MNRQGDLFQYPNRPGFKQYGTSREAAAAIEPRAHTLRGKALAAIKAAGPSGLTADEAADILRRSVASIRPRVTELLVLGLIVRNGKRRKNKSGLFADAYAVKAMTSRPIWMPLYVRDYLADTRHLTTLQHGAYLLLIMEYWTKGRLPERETTLRAITSLDRKQWHRNKSVLGAMFEQPGWRHPRIDAELKKAFELKLKRQVYGAKGARISRGRDNVARFTLVNTDPSKSPTKS